MQCMRIAGMEDELQAFLDQGKSDAEICEIVTADAFAVATDAAEVGGELSCTMCQRFVQMVDQALEQQVQTVEQVRAIIGDLCNAMAEDSMCHTFLKHYDEVVDWLKHGTDPMVVCTYLTMCTPTPQPPKFPLIDAVEDDYALVTYDENDGKKPHGCFFCVHVAEVVRQVNKTEPDKLPIVKTILDNVCKLTPSDCKCDEIDKDFDKLVELVKQGECPHKICKSLGFCKKPTPDTQVVVASNDDSLYGNNTCLYCDAATTFLQILEQEQPDQVDMIREYADMICGMLGDDSPCHEYVNQLDTVIDALKKGTHPRDICKSLNYCSASMSIGEAADATALAIVDEEDHHHHHHGCKFCVHVGIVIHEVNKTEPEKLPVLKDLLANVCELAPTDCNCTTVSQNFDKIVELEKEGNCPFQACKAIGVCKKKDERAVDLYTDEEPSAADAIMAIASSMYGVSNETYCAYCTYATTIIRIAIMQYGQEIAEIRQYADMICDMLGADSQCHTYVSQLDTVLDAIKEGKSSHEICALLKYCTASNAVAPNVLAIEEDLDDDDSLALVSVDDRHHHHHGCSFCIRVAMIVRHVNKTAPAKLPVVKKILDDACQLTPADCKCDVVDSNFDKIVELVKNGTCPIKICKEIGLCKKPSGTELTQELVDTEPFMDTVMALVTADYDYSSPRGDGVNCYVCDYVTSLVQVALEQDAQKVDQIRTLADAFCDLLGVESGCHQYVKQLDFVTDSLKNGTHPHAICVSLKYCSAEDSPVQALSAFEDKDEFDSAVVLMIEDAMSESVDPCFFCSQVTTVIQVVLQQKPSEIEMVRQISDMVCGMLPADNKVRSHRYAVDIVQTKLTFSVTVVPPVCA